MSPGGTRASPGNRGRASTARPILRGVGRNDDKLSPTPGEPLRNVEAASSSRSRSRRRWASSPHCGVRRARDIPSARPLRGLVEPAGEDARPDDERDDQEPGRVQSRPRRPSERPAHGGPGAGRVSCKGGGASPRGRHAGAASAPPPVGFGTGGWRPQLRHLRARSTRRRPPHRPPCQGPRPLQATRSECYRRGRSRGRLRL
jgi:hypothetical protein